MSKVGQIERLTQNRIVKLLTQELDYTYLGNWEDCPGNSNIEEGANRGIKLVNLFFLHPAKV